MTRHYFAGARVNYCFQICISRSGPVTTETKQNFGDKMRFFLLNSSLWLFAGVFLLCLSFSFGNKVEDEGSCRVYAGGQVYPQERKTSEHALHWSKAQISKPAPYWEGTAVVDGEFKSLNITDFLGKYLVFFFYPMDFTFVCPTEIIAFSNRIEEFRKINTAVVACSVDSVFTHLAWINTPRKDGGLGKLSYPLLSDLNHQIAKDYGVLLENEGHTLRGLFIIDDKGVLRQITMNDLPVGRSVDETLRLVQAFQYTDKHGEVCPAGWKPGADTIVPDPKEKLDYFTKHDEEGPDSPEKDEM